MDTLVEYAVDGQFARLTLNSPHNRNALSSTLVGQLHQGLRDAADDPAVRVVVLGHTGNTFCAGADLSEGSAATADPAEATAQRSREMATLLRAIVESPRPVIVAVDGHVRAGGMGLVAACDIAVAGPRSTFASLKRFQRCIPQCTCIQSTVPRRESVRMIPPGIIAMLSGRK